MNWFVYILRCSDDSLYTGVTTDIDRRVKQHNLRKGAKYLKGKLPASLVYKEQMDSRPTALRRELEIKAWPREKKLELIKYI